MKKLKSKIDFKPSNMDAFDGEKLPSFYLLDEAGQYSMPDPNFDLQKALIRAKHRRSNNNLIFTKPKTKKK